MSDRLDVAIVGGGVAGLTVGWRLHRARPALRIAVLEAGERAGGRIHTEHLAHDDGQFIIELGADSLVEAKPWARDLCRDLGIEHELIPVATSPAPTAIWHDGHPVDLPAGLGMLGPTQPEPFRASGLLSPAGTERALQEPTIPPDLGSEDESLGSFIRRRYGDEYLDAIGEPLLAGISNADPDELSLLGSFPNFRKLEQTYGSVTRGAQQLPPSPGKPAFSAPRDGIQRIPDTLAAHLGRLVRTGCRVERITPIAPDGYRLTLRTGEPITARAVVLATPLSAATLLLLPIAPDAAPLLARLKAASSGAVVLAWRDEQITRPLRGFGLVAPKRERQPFNAITIMSKKYAGRAPAGWTVARFFFGGYRSPQTLELDDDALLQATRDFAALTLGAQGAPAFHRIARWPEGSPIYQVGHFQTIAALEATLPPGIALIGAPFHGPGIPDVVRSATDCANRLAASFVPATA